MFLNSSKEIKKHGAKLPHWQQGEVMQFVTFRLADALPQSLVQRWKEERETWIRLHPKPWTDSKEQEYHQRFTGCLEKSLDQGLGSCLLSDVESRGHLENTLMRDHGDRAVFEAWVIMPNHVHILVVPQLPMGDLLKSWKGISARKIGRGSIWQQNYRDTLIRDQEHFENVVRYIRRNPRKLRKDEFSLWEGEKAQGV